EDPWCKSCKQRSQTCIYEAMVPRGRPQSRSERGAEVLEASVPASSRNRYGPYPSGDLRRLRSSPSIGSRSENILQVENRQSTRFDSYGAELRSIFPRLWGEDGSRYDLNVLNIIQATGAEVDQEDPVGGPKAKVRLPHDGTIGIMICEMMDSLGRVLTPLGCHPLGAGSQGSFFRCLKEDPSSAMFNDAEMMIDACTQG
ncbi:hypothetical protein IE53DRAFT_386496, partial [Violaceomyces palustris]